LRKDAAAAHARPPDSEGDSRRLRVLLAAEHLFAERGFHNVTVRDIAAKARVTHPLIYYYWPSKDALLAAVNERNQARMRAVADQDAAPLDAIAAIVRENLAHSHTYLLTVTRALLDGMPPREWPGGFPGIESVIRLLEGSRPARAGDEADTEVRELAAVATAMLNGWVLIEDQFLEIVGLSASDREHAREVLVESIRRVLAPAVPSPTPKARRGRR
jgi:AcrR family transcriptional regulator